MRVKRTGRTWVLLLVAGLAATVMTLFSQWERARRGPLPSPAPADDDAVEFEIEVEPPAPR